MKQTQENVTLKEVNQSIKMQNSHLSGQIDKLKRLCHLCLNLIMTSQQQQQQNQQKNQPLSSSTSSGLKTVKSDNTLNVTANEQSPSPDSPVEDEIELLILEYLYGGSGSADGNSSADNTTQLVKRFEELASRLAAVTEGVKSTVSDSAKLKNLTVQKQQQQQQYLQSPCEQKKHKRSLIKRLLSGFHHQNELESSRNGAQKTSSKAQFSTTPTSPTPSISSPMCTHLANSAATAAGHHHHHHQSKHQNSHLRPSNSIQKLHEFFELQQENQRILPKACSAQEAAEEAENEEANQLTVTNNYHLQVAHIKAMNGGVGSPTKSVSATEEHSGAQLSTHIDVNGIVDTAPKMSEVAMFCGLKENNVANPLLNVAKQKEAEKRHQQEEEKAKASKAKKNGQEEEDEKEEQRKKDSVSVMDSSFFVSLYTLQQQQLQKPIFEIGLLDDDVEEEEESGRKEEEVVSDDSDDGQPSPPDSVVDSSYDADSLLEEMDMEQEMDRLLEHIHQHQWFVLPAEATAPAASDVVNLLNAEVIDLNNVEAAFQAIHRLWLARKHSTTRLLFFYQMFSYLFDKYLNVIHCDCHHPPCAPSVEATLFGKLGVQIVRRLLECINRSRHLVIQIELLSSIESLVYNRTHYRPALSEVFHHLFTAGLIEATAFVEWAKLDDPSAQFEAAQNKQNSSCGNGQPPTSAEQKQQKTPSKETKSKLKASLSMPPKLTTMTMTTASAAAASASSSSSSAQQTETQLTNRERLFQELKKAGFAIFKCKF